MALINSDELLHIIDGELEHIYANWYDPGEGEWDECAAEQNGELDAWTTIKYYVETLAKEKS